MENCKQTVLLVHPEISRTRYNFVGVIENECLELEYISAVLKQHGHRVVMFDKQVETISMPQKLSQVKPDVVYVCGRTRQENFIKEYCRDAKAFDPEILTIVGGLHVQHARERLFEEYIDYLLITFDVFQLLPLIDRQTAEPDYDRLEQLDGICYRQHGIWQINEAKPFDINRLPLPDRSYFESYPDNYRYLALPHAAHVRTSYCCPYSCRFCYRNRLNSGTYIQRDMESVVAEIGAIKSPNIYLVDDDFLYDRERILTFIRLIKQQNIKKQYICYGRSDFIAGNRDLMIELKAIGFYYVLVGLEAIGEERLTQYQKRSHQDYNLASVRILNEIGINIMGMFIIDLDFRAEDFRALYRWIKKHGVRHVALSIYTPEFGLATYDEMSSRLITDNPSHWDYLHVVARPLHMSVRHFYICYYLLMIRLFFKSKREGVYDFIDYGDYIRSFFSSMITMKRKNDNE